MNYFINVISVTDSSEKGEGKGGSVGAGAEVAWASSSCLTVKTKYCKYSYLK